jgi:cytochrome c oxidase cbb3-type subunit 4
MDAATINLLREAVTVASFLGFLGIVAFAVNPRNKQRFDEAAKLPFAADMEPPPQPSPKGEGAMVGQGFANLERKQDE